MQEIEHFDKDGSRDGVGEFRDCLVFDESGVLFSKGDLGLSLRNMSGFWPVRDKWRSIWR